MRARSMSRWRCPGLACDCWSSRDVTLMPGYYKLFSVLSSISIELYLPSSLSVTIVFLSLSIYRTVVDVIS